MLILQADAVKLLQYAKEINEKLDEKIELDEKLLKQLSYLARGDLAPMNAVIGGLVAQEVLKVGSPLHFPP